MASSVANVMFTNAVYYPSSKVYAGFTPGMMNYNCISHVYYAYASVTADGTVFVSPPTPKAGHAEARASRESRRLIVGAGGTAQ
jgi:chitinase